MLAKLKKAYVNFTLTFAIPLLILNAITGHYSAWYDRKMEDAETLFACRKLADKGLGTKEECQEEFNNSYENFLAEDICTDADTQAIKETMQGLATKSFALYAAEKGIKSNSKD